MALLVGLVVASCAGPARRQSAEERADRLNSEKAKAEKLIESGRYQPAIDVLGPLSEEASADHQLFSMLGKACAKLGRFDEAVKYYEEAIRKAYSDYHPHLELATLLMEHEKTGRALTEFELAVRFGAREPVTRYNYGLALFDMGRKKEALEQWRLAFDAESDNPKYAQAVGMALTGVNDAEAITYFDTAARLGADDAGFHNNYGLALQRVKQHQRALKQFETAVGLTPVNEDFRFNLSTAHMISGSYQEAVASWDTLIEREGPRWSYLVYRGEALLRLERFEEAITAVEAVAADVENGRLAAGSDRLDRMPPNLNHAFEILAMGYRGMGDNERALDYIRRALAIDPRKVSHLNNYGVILAESGMIEQAKAQWRKVLEIDVENATAKGNLSAFER